MIMPYTKVKFRSALIGGITAGTIYGFTQWGYIFFQVGVTRYNAIYGSFAALPLFLIWLQLSWLIILLGAEISFAHQNVETFEYEEDSKQMSNSFKRMLSLLVAHSLVKNFGKGKEPLTASEIAMKLHLPIRLVNRILNELVEAKIISETQYDTQKAISFQPAQDTDRLSLQFVMDSLDEEGFCELKMRETEDASKLAEALNSFKITLANSAANKLLKDI